ncbi:MAG: apolipoprotein N-acyltransferase [Vulcanimicrobiaceae bacterium]
MVSSLIPFVAATLGAVVMALAFPKTNASIFAPLGAVALFWAWFGVSPKRAFWIGWLAGTVFFAINFWWFGETAGALIAPFGFALALAPAIGVAFFGFALVGALVAFAAEALARRDRIARALVPLAAAAIFAVGEWLRSEGLGLFGVPFGGLGYTQVGSPLAPLAAFGGSYGITFVVCALGAYGAFAIRLRAVRGSGIDAGIAAIAALALVALAWLLWPARTVPVGTHPVAAVQGNIAQTLKFTPAAFAEAVTRYEALTLRAAKKHPALIVWPETVIPAPLNRYPELTARFAALAKRTHAELAIGTNYATAEGPYNVLYFFSSDGGFDAIYRKRQLVPFAETLPFAALLGSLPWAQNSSRFLTGTANGLVAVDGLRYGPIICWESAFTDLVGGDVRDGATALIVATDDAWFGSTAGPYQHAQIAQMRALETGRWIVRAASTGISGLIAPNGRFTRASNLNEQAIVTGTIGSSTTTAYDSIGGNGVAFALGALACGIVLFGRRERGRR